MKSNRVKQKVAKELSKSDEKETKKNRVVTKASTLKCRRTFGNMQEQKNTRENNTEVTITTDRKY